MTQSSFHWNVVSQALPGVFPKVFTKSRDWTVRTQLSQTENNKFQPVNRLQPEMSAKTVFLPEDSLLSTKLQSHETFIGDPQNWKDSQSISYLQSLSVPVTWKSDSGIIIWRIRKRKPKGKVFITNQFQILMWSIERNKKKNQYP